MHACLHTSVSTCIQHICVMGMLEDFGGHGKVVYCPQSTVCLQMAAVLASQMQGLMNAGW